MPDDDFMNIQYAVLDALGQDLVRSKNEAQKAMDTLEAALNANLNGVWASKARALYDGDKAKWSTTFAHMDAILQQAVKHIGDTHDLYTSTEKVNMSMWTL